VRGGDRKTGTVLGKGGHACLLQAGAVDLGAVEQDAELIATHAIGSPMWLYGAPEPVAQPHQQRVARGMPEGVVVALEPVEVIEHQLPWLVWAGCTASE
jgi:hypothetical protein